MPRALALSLALAGGAAWAGVAAAEGSRAAGILFDWDPPTTILLGSIITLAVVTWGLKRLLRLLEA